MFPYSVPFSCKISKNILEWILTTKCKSFWAKIGIKKYQIKFNRNFFKILFIATFVYLILWFMLNVSSFLQDFKKIFWVRFRKHEQAFGQIWIGIPQFGPKSVFFKHTKYSNAHFISLQHFIIVENVRKTHLALGPKSE